MGNRDKAGREAKKPKKDKKLKAAPPTTSVIPPSQHATERPAAPPK